MSGRVGKIRLTKPGGPSAATVRAEELRALANSLDPPMRIETNQNVNLLDVDSIYDVPVTQIGPRGGGRPFLPIAKQEDTTRPQVRDKKTGSLRYPYNIYYKSKTGQWIKVDSSRGAATRSANSKANIKALLHRTFPGVKAISRIAVEAAQHPIHGTRFITSLKQVLPAGAKAIARTDAINALVYSEKFLPRMSKTGQPIERSGKRYPTLRQHYF